MADLVLPRGKIKVLKAEEKDYERGLLVRLLNNGGYDMAYWYNKPDKPYPVEVLVDGKSIKKDAKEPGIPLPLSNSFSFANSCDKLSIL